jgi:hypothetical protein
VRQARVADNSVLLVVPNGKVRMGAQHSSLLPPNPHELLRESFTDFSKNPNMKCQENVSGRGINGRMRSLCERASDIAFRSQTAFLCFMQLSQ